MTRDTYPDDTSFFSVPRTGLFPWFRSHARHRTGPHREPTLAEKGFEDVFAEWVLVAVWTAIAYYGVSLTSVAWYWPVGVGFVLGFGVYKILSGPLRILVSGLRRSSLVIATLGTVVVFVLQVGT